MAEEQERRCLICRRHEDELNKKLVVDHCHSTGQVRGLLCCGCNKGIGCLREDTSALASAILYLENARCAS